jgi:hypothetical protein
MWCGDNTDHGQHRIVKPDETKKLFKALPEYYFEEALLG